MTGPLPGFLAGPPSVSAQQELQRVHEAVMRGLGFGNDDPRTNGEAAVVARLRGRGPVVVFDVGANRGAYTALVLEQLGDAVHVHAFEPSGTAYAELERRHAGDPRVALRRLALGDVEGSAPLFGERPGSEMGSLYRRDLARFGIEMQVQETVEVRRLDSLVPALGIGRIDLLKVDVEGHDLAVLRGAGDLLDGRTIGMIQFEYGGTGADARVFLRDYFQLLMPRYVIHRVLPDGLWPLPSYREIDEVALYANYVALPAG